MKNPGCDLPAGQTSSPLAGWAARFGPGPAHTGGCRLWRAPHKQPRRLQPAPPNFAGPPMQALLLPTGRAKSQGQAPAAEGRTEGLAPSCATGTTKSVLWAAAPLRRATWRLWEDWVAPFCSHGANVEWTAPASRLLDQNSRVQDTADTGFWRWRGGSRCKSDGSSRTNQSIKGASSPPCPPPLAPGSLCPPRCVPPGVDALRRRWLAPTCLLGTLTCERPPHCAAECTAPQSRPFASYIYRNTN